MQVLFKTAKMNEINKFFEKYDHYKSPVITSFWKNRNGIPPIFKFNVHKPFVPITGKIFFFATG